MLYSEEGLFGTVPLEEGNLTNSDGLLPQEILQDSCDEIAQFGKKILRSGNNFVN